MPSVLGLALLLCAAFAALASNTITGSVRNQSRGQPAVGEEVILIRLDQGMQEEEHTRTDPEGGFWLKMQYPDKPYLVRVKHQNVNYDQRAKAGGAITIPVFDVADHVPEISGAIEILRAGLIGKSLHVSDMFEIRNASSPPFTQSGERTFEVYLPTNAKLDSVLAAGPEKIGVMISAAAVPGAPGHYAVNFPLLPGTTKFAFNYDMPYNGYVSFQTWHANPLQQLVVVIPTTMKFSSRLSKFQILGMGASNYQVRAVGQVMAGQGPAFTISGTGDFPPLRSQTNTSASSQPPVPPNSNLSGPDRLLPPSSRDTGSHVGTLSGGHTLVWVGTGFLFLSVCICILITWRTLRVRTDSTGGRSVLFATPRQRPGALLDAVKDDLFQLETDRIRGSVSGEEYASARKALEQIVERAVATKQDDSKRI